MKSFRLVPASEGPRREFKITLGLRAGYGSAGRIYDLEEAVRTAHHWMWERAARGEPFLSGMFTRGEVVYADSGGAAASHREPVAIFAGEVLPQYAGGDFLRAVAEAVQPLLMESDAEGMIRAGRYEQSTSQE